MILQNRHIVSKKGIIMNMYFKETAEKFLTSNKSLLPFAPFPRASEREPYESLPSELRANLIASGEMVLGKGFAQIRATDFMAFKRTGNRVNFEDIYFGKRHDLNSLVVAECVENQGRFLDDIIDGIFSLCEESAWQLPPHNSYERSKPQEILPDSTRPVMDLFACESGSQLACILYLLGEQLDAVSPFITKRIRYELEHRILTPYLQEHFWWMGKDEEPMCNWTPWCTQNVLYTAFLWAASTSHPFHSDAPVVPPFLANTCHGGISPEPVSTDSLLRAVLAKAAASCDYFLKDYGEDGCCDEGAQYYRHAGLCLDGAASVLNAVTGGAFAELMLSSKIKNIAAYIYHVHVNDKYYFNFADCSPIAGRAGVREYLFGKNTAQPGLMQFAADDFRASHGDIFADESNQLNLFYRLQTIFHYCEVMNYHHDAPLVHEDIYYPSVGLFLTRNETFSLAVKSGCNNDSHNHNDTGSITVFKEGQPILADIGVESYTAKTFSAHRYEIWTMQSGYHNLPTLEGLDQHDGAQYRASNVVTSDIAAPGTVSISMDLETAYPLPADSDIKYHREVTFSKDANLIRLTDRTNSQNVILNFITYDTPIADDTGSCISVGKASLTFRGAKLLAIETLPITDKRLQTAWEHDMYRIRLQMTGDTFAMDVC